MKRPLGVIGLIYLSALAVFFHFGTGLVTPLICGGAAAAVVGAVIWKLARKESRVPVKIIAASLSVLAAAVALMLFRAWQYDPIVNDYSNKEIYVEGYVREEPVYSRSYTTVVIQAEKIDSEPRSCRISFTFSGDVSLEPFDVVKVRITPSAADSSYLLSRKIFLSAFEASPDIVRTGDKHFTPYQWAVSLRQSIKQTFKRWLEPGAASVSSAALLGDKKALPGDVRDAFTKTGVSYLIVVSGMHLSIASFLLLLLLRKTNAGPLITVIVMSAFILLFVAVTGFTPSVMRAGIMMFLIYLAQVLFQEVDGINSLGTAALLLTVTNPFSVGDIGLLLSFAATFGILLWSDRLYRYIAHILHLNQLLNENPGRVKRLIIRLTKAVLGFLCTSLTATLWVLPVTLLFFESIAPLTVLISCVAYPLTFAVLFLSLIFAVIGLTGFAFVPLVPLLNTLSAWLIRFVKWCATLPFCQVIADEAFYYVWLAVSAVLVAVGYAIHARKAYVFAAVMASVLTLSTGAALTRLLVHPSASLLLIRSGSGYTAAVRRGENLSLLSCGGSSRGFTVLREQMRRTQRIDNIILTSALKRNTAYLGQLTTDFDVGNVLMYAPKYEEGKAPAEDVRLFDDNTGFTLVLNSEVNLRVTAVKGKVYQYITSGETAVLLVPKNADFNYVPEEMRHPNIAVLEDSAAHLDLLDCNKVLTLSEKNTSGADVLKNGEMLEIQLSK